MPFNRDDEDEDSTFDEVSAMADRLGLKGPKKQAYIDDHMQGLGYEPVQTRETYRRVQQAEEEEGGGSYGRRWGFGGGGRTDGGAGQSRSRRDDDDRF